MSRFKFRFWKSKVKQMHYPEYSWDDDFVIMPDGTIMRNKTLPGWDQCPSLETVDGVLMQFTGLVDKNGKDIYEGDVCAMRLPPYNEDDTETIRTVFVVWKNNGWFLEGFNHLYGTYYWGSITGQMLEIKGNIYENPELTET